MGFLPTRWVMGGLLLAGLTGSRPALAQGGLDAPGFLVPKPIFDRSEVKNRPEAWPRLDRGAVFCKTEADLLRLAAARRGEAGPPPACQIMRDMTPIKIVRRIGPGRTVVALTEKGDQEGWTDAWLPDKAPANTNPGRPIR